MNDIADIQAFADQIRDAVLGTDGFGRSDTRANLRRHFKWIASISRMPRSRRTKVGAVPRNKGADR